ncbi:MAG: DUF3352 domain-containing protein [Planctomycetes bacterium]|nr:DUF3352 domain-containing protein [Planctomycetota bacterium]
MQRLWAALIMFMFMASCVFCGDAAAKPDPLERFSQDTLFAATINRTDKAAEGWDETVLAKLLKAEEVQRFLQIPTAKLDEMIEKVSADKEINLRGLLAALSNNASLSFALKLSREIDRRRGPNAVLTLYSEVADAKAAEDIIAQVPAILKAMDVNPQDIKVSPTSFDAKIGGRLIVQAKGSKVRMFIFSPGWDITADAGALIAEATPKSKAESFAALPHIAKARKSIAESPVGSWYLNAAPVIEFFANPDNQNRELRRNWPVIDALGLNGIEVIAGDIAIDAPGFTSKTYIGAKSLDKGLFGLFGKEAVSQNILKAIPKTSLMACASRTRMDGIMPLVREVMQSSGMQKEMFDQQIQMMTMQFGFNPEEDILNSLGDESAFILLDSSRVTGPAFFGLNGLSMVAKLKNPEKVKQALSRVCQIGAAVGSQSEIGGGLYQTDHNGTAIVGTKVASGLFTPSFCVKDDLLVVGFGPGAVEYILNTIDGKIENITADEKFAKAFEKTGGLACSAITYIPYPRVEMPGEGIGGSYNLATTGVMAGMLLPALSRARTAARKANDMNNLKQIGLGIEMYASDEYKGKMPESFAELYDNGNGIIGDPKAFASPSDGAGYHYIKGLPKNAYSSCIVAFTADSSYPDGRIALYRDCHVRFLKRDAFEEELAYTVAKLDKDGVKYEILPPWFPDDVMPMRVAGHSPFEELDRDPLKVFRQGLDAIPVYLLPSSETVNRDMYPASATMRMLDGGILLTSHSPIPVLTTVGNDKGSTSSLMSAMPLLSMAAVAIPNIMPRSRYAAPVSRLEANETNAVASLKTFGAAQNIYLKARYSVKEGQPEKRYAISLAELGEKQLIPGVMAAATSPEKGYQGYYFQIVTKEDPKYAYAAYAIPCRYGVTGTNTFFIDTQGIVFMKDTKGKLPENDDPHDGTWQIP